MILGLRTMVSAVLVIIGILVAPIAAHAAASSSWESVTLRAQKAHAAGTTIAWAELGSGPPLLLLNGTASPMSEWDPALLAALAKDNHVIVLDYPGLGFSGASPATWTFPQAADWIAEFITQVSPDAPVNVMGWSMGGFIAQQLAIRHPDLVNGLVLAATNPGGSQAVLGPTWVQEIDSSSSSDADYLLTNYPPAARAAGRRFLQRLETAVDSGAYPYADTPARTLRAMVAAEDPWLRSDANLRQLASITAPTLVIDGARDVITPPRNSRVLAARIPDSALVLVPGAGHSFLFQRPDSSAAAITAFLHQRAS